MDDNLPLLIPVPGAQAKLNVGRSTIYKLVDLGELTRVNIGRRSFITAQSLDAYVQRLISAAAG